MLKARWRDEAEQAGWSIDDDVSVVEPGRSTVVAVDADEAVAESARLWVQGRVGLTFSDQLLETAAALRGVRRGSTRSRSRSASTRRQRPTSQAER